MCGGGRGSVDSVELDRGARSKRNQPAPVASLGLRGARNAGRRSLPLVGAAAVIVGWILDGEGWCRWTVLSNIKTARPSIGGTWATGGGRRTDRRAAADRGPSPSLGWTCCTPISRFARLGSDADWPWSPRRSVGGCGGAADRGRRLADGPPTRSAATTSDRRAGPVSVPDPGPAQPALATTGRCLYPRRVGLRRLASRAG